MDSEEYKAWQDRVQQKARELWEEHGCPDEGPSHFADMAQELIGIAENPQATTRPAKDPRAPDAEPAIAIENQGEFPTLTDQGEDQGYPTPRKPVPDRPTTQGPATGKDDDDEDPPVSPV